MCLIDDMSLKCVLHVTGCNTCANNSHIPTSKYLEDTEETHGFQSNATLNIQTYNILQYVANN